MKPGPASAITLLPKYLTLAASPERAVEILSRIVMGEGWQPTESLAFESAETWETAFLTRCSRLIGERNDKGLFCEFALNSSSSDMLQGACFVEGGDSPEVAEAKRRRLAHQDYKVALSALSPTEFEWVCRGIIAAMGASDAVVTRRSADEGIDFFGRLQFQDVLRAAGPLPGFYKALSVWLVGQAKHYKETRLATPDIRQLVGSVDLARAGAFARPNAIGSLKMRVCDPVFYLFLTTGRISRDGEALMAASGVVGMDGDAVAAFLADHDIGCDAGGFNEELLREWVGSNAPAGAG